MPDSIERHVRPGPLTPLELFQGLLEQSKDYAFVLMDPDGRIVGWHGAASTLFGYSEAEMLGRLIDDIFTREDRALGLPSHERLVAAADSRSEDDRWHVRKDGTRIWMTGTVEKVVDHRGVLVGYSKVMRDRTDLRAHMEATENRLQAFAHRQEATGVFFARLVHELRNVLSPMGSNLEFLRRCTEPQQTAAPVEALGREMAVLVRVLDDVMDLASSHAGHLQLTWSTFDLAEELRSLERTLQQQAQRKQQKLQVLVPPGPVRLRADRERVHQIVVNLVSNALKYTPEGGAIWIKCTLEPNHVLMRVEDTGIGIAPDLLPTIFDLFTRATTSGQGLGVGLTLVHDLVQAHGGTVEVRSSGVGKGSEFAVRLPLEGIEPLAGRDG